MTKVYISTELGSDDGILRCSVSNTLKEARKLVATWYGDRKKDVRDEIDCTSISKNFRCICCYDCHYDYNIFEREIQ